ncbi:peptidase S41 [Fibrisoma limi BUZ 3]|uniref:Peptidase S41 n=2 Tax=Fibrisoma limi TaxID=663275 RepID=I2GTR1_9BACT|nr:peptidase S41 [Fibrisoma limi BUZ 3]
MSFSAKKLPDFEVEQLSSTPFSDVQSGLRTMFSGIGVYYPDGLETQRIGIVPDIDVKPTIQGIREGRDELLERAVELIKGQTQAGR